MFHRNSELFLSLHLMRNLHFDGSSLVALLACNVFFSRPLKTQIQTITRRAVILPASGMSENLLLISHVKKIIKNRVGGVKNVMFVTFLASPQMIGVAAGIHEETMSSVLLCKIPLQKTQRETGRGLIALTLADSGQTQNYGTADCHIQFTHTFSPFRLRL